MVRSSKTRTTVPCGFACSARIALTSARLGDRSWAKRFAARSANTTLRPNGVNRSRLNRNATEFQAAFSKALEFAKLGQTVPPVLVSRFQARIARIGFGYVLNDDPAE